MAEIEIKTKENQKGWNFDVQVREGRSQTQHQVSLERKNFDELGLEKNTSPEELLRKSFEFLLERESKESILSSFDLMVIARYFPEYPSEISARLKNSDR